MFCENNNFKPFLDPLNKLLCAGFHISPKVNFIKRAEKTRFRQLNEIYFSSKIQIALTETFAPANREGGEGFFGFGGLGEEGYGAFYNILPRKDLRQWNRRRVYRLTV